MSSGIAFKTEEFGEALKDFVGQIVATDYALEPFGMKGAPEIKRKGKVLCIQIRTDAYEKDQFEWYPPSRVKKTKTASEHPVLTSGCSYRLSAHFGGRYSAAGVIPVEPSRRGGGAPVLGFRTPPPASNLAGVIWAYFIEALNAVGAMKDVSIAGASDEERMASVAQSLLGMSFRWQELECESLVKERGGAVKTFNLLTPIEYLGKTAIEAAPEVRQATIGETVGEPPLGEVATEGAPAAV